MLGLYLITDVLRKVDLNIVTSALIATILFSIVYSFLGDNHFSGMTKIDTNIKKVHNTIKESLIKQDGQINTGLGFERDPAPVDNIESYDNFDALSTNPSHPLPEGILQHTRQEATVKPGDSSRFDSLKTMANRFGNRFYFSVVTGSTVGFGDIYPKTPIAKFITSLQILVMFGLLLKS